MSRQSGIDVREEMRFVAIGMIERFVSNALRENFLHPVDGYELALATVGCKTNVEFNALLKALMEAIRLRTEIKTMEVPWSAVIRVFMRPDEKPYKPHLRTQDGQDDTLDWAGKTVARLIQ